MGAAVKGIVFNLLREVVVRNYSEDVWDDLIDDAGVGGAYTSLGSYPDAEMEALVGAASKRLGLPRNAVLRWFGQQAMPLLFEHYPAFFEGHDTARSVILSVNDIIHVEVRKLYVGAECPHFQFREDDDGSLAMGYVSTRKLCALAQGFVEGAATHYGEPVDFEHTTCVDHGDAHCRFRVRWPIAA